MKNSNRAVTVSWPDATDNIISQLIRCVLILAVRQ